MAHCSWPCNSISHLFTPAGADTVAETCKGRLKGQRRLCDASAIRLRSLLGWVGEEAGLPGVHLPSGRAGRSDPPEARGRPLVPCRSRLTSLEGGSSFWLGVWGFRPVLPSLCYDVCMGTASWGLCHEQALWLLLAVLWGGLCSPEGFPGGPSGKEPACQCRRRRRRGFDPWVGKVSWRRARQPSPVFLPGEPHGQRSLVGLQLTGSQRVGQNLPTEHTHMPPRGILQGSPVFPPWRQQTSYTVTSARFQSVSELPS